MSPPRDFMARIFSSFQRYMYFSVHLLLFRGQIISIASWYMFEVTCSSYFSVNVDSYGSLGVTLLSTVTR